jgi:hypothetical protein
MPKVGIENDGAALAHQRHHGLYREEDAFHIDVHQLGIGGLVGATDGCTQRRASIGEEDVDRAERSLGFLAHADEIGNRLYIGADGDGVAANLSPRALELGGIGAGDGDASAVFVKQLCGDKADTA